MREIKIIEPQLPSLKVKKSVAAYSRVSIESEHLLHSLSSQISYYSELIHSNPYWIYVGVYVDRGISGTQAYKRDGFKRLINDCKKGKIDIILVKSISRFARNTVELLKTVRNLKSIGVEVRFEKEHINSLSSDGELMLSILASFAQEESRSISENVKWAVQNRFKQGLPNGRIAVFGYVWKGDTLKVEFNEAKTVKRIFQYFLDGKTPRNIAHELDKDGIRTKNGCKWSDFSIRTILQNITYTGNLLLQKEFVDNLITKHRIINKGELPRYFVENTHEAIINTECFNSAQAEFIKRSKYRKSVFTKKIKCAGCGAYYIRNTISNNQHYKLWVCSTKKNNGCKACDAKNIREDCLKYLSTVVLELAEFDENIFLDRIENITINGNILYFKLKSGIIINKMYTGKKEIYINEKSNNNPGNSKPLYCITDNFKRKTEGCRICKSINGYGRTAYKLRGSGGLLHQLHKGQR